MKFNDPLRRRLTLLFMGMLLLAGGVIAKAVKLQIIGDSRLEAMEKRQFQSKVLLKPRRGTITDRNGESLAINIETQSLAANPSKIKNKRTFAKLLSKALDLPFEKVLDKVDDKKEFVWIKRHLAEAELNHLRKWRLMDESGELSNGLWLVKENQRTYPHNELAGHLLGSVNVDSEGMEGVEMWLNQRLTGQVVSVNAVRDALGRPTFLDAVAAKGLKDGQSVALTIDASLQFAVEEELREAVQKHGAKSGTVIVMDAMTGEILAMANEPSFNPNHKNAPSDRRRERALTDGYEPGSTMKPLMLTGALSAGMKLTDTVYGERGKYQIQGHTISEAEAHEKYEWISLKRMIQVSSNIGAAKLALKYGADRYFNHLKSLGFGAKTETGFPGEISGRVPPRKSWQPLALANIGFGQGILVTPIQMIRAYAAIANGGILVQPKILKDPADLVKAEAPKRVFSQKVADSVTEALLAVTNGEEGSTGVKANLDGYRVAGKTGTAQKVDPITHRYARNKHIASFIGFPMDTNQKFVIYSMMDEPKGVYYASETSAPLFSRVLQAVVNRFSIPASPALLAQAQQKKARQGMKDSLQTHQAHPAPANTAMTAPKVATLNDEAEPKLAVKFTGADAEGRSRWEMPNLRGMTSREILKTLDGKALHVEMRGFGIVRYQWPEAGHEVTEGGVVRLQLGEP